jgi:hypothetical protein
MASAASLALHSSQEDKTVKVGVPIPGIILCKVRLIVGDIYMINIHLYLCITMQNVVDRINFNETLFPMYYVDEENCLADVCQHGTCTDGVDTFTCVCDAGWDGENCDRSKWNCCYAR